MFEPSKNPFGREEWVRGVGRIEQVAPLGFQRFERRFAGEYLCGVRHGLPLGQALFVQVARDFADEISGVVSRARVGVRIALGQFGDGVLVVCRLFVEVIERV